MSRTKGRNIGKGNRLEAYNGTEYTYDALGNMIYRQLPNGESQLFQYDSENQLIRAEIKKPKGNTEIWEYAYDPFGRRLSKERKDKLAWTSTAPKRTHFVWDGTRLLQEYTYKGSYTYVYTDQDSYEPLAQIFDNAKDGKQYLSYFHNDQIGIPREMTDIHGNLLWYGSYSAWGSLASEKRIYENIHQPFRLQNQYFDAETGLHYNFFRYYEAETGRFTNQDPIGLVGGENLYFFAPNGQVWVDVLGLVPLGGVAGYLSPAHRGDGLDAHEMLRNAFLKDSPLTKISSRSGAKGNPAMGLTKDLHREVHNAEAALRASRGMGRNDFFRRGKQEIRIMYQAMEQVLVRTHGIITQNQLRQMRQQAIKFAKKHRCY
ncbi:RHS domain-containing protein [Neisseria sp. Dent CA1/247]|uniref:RHS repeat domain-containing protein n=1 Tax=Neisseria sp. Dent CA1/247 TaxID=2912675 RepID=UPI001FD521F5|nr:RHS repeat-associated core domain-containing protein [Neisseria sp. Dent CA1/247]UOO78254.1 RHS domain-containing protein [Neisseria sp. Dent CA1/247]